MNPIFLYGQQIGQIGSTQMKLSKNQIGVSILSILFFWTGAANAMSVDGITVEAIGSQADAGRTNSAGQTVYYIPLSEDTTGTYGYTEITCGNGSSGTAGTCYDRGDGAGYVDASALEMNIFFDKDVSGPLASASLDFWFRDLDLVGVNDPFGFFESLSLSYWDGEGDGSTLTRIGADAIINATDLAPGTADISSVDPITWSLDLATLGVLPLLSNSDGFWVQLGFGSDFHTDGRNTAERLTAQLNVSVSAVPVPAAFWLFGTALIGFIGMSRRTRV